MAPKKEKKKRIQLCNARQIISSFYAKLFTLLSFIRKVKKESGEQLIQDGDPADYKFLLKSTLVAVPRDLSKAPPFKPSNTHWFTLKEITNRVIEHVCRSNKSNVLALGFEPLRGNGRSGTVAGTIGIQNSYPNTIVSYIRTSKAWLLLHKRVGDDLMIHLLQNVAMFVKTTSKCYFQVAGFPISRMSPLTEKGVDAPHKLGSIKRKKQKHTDAAEKSSRAVRKSRRGGKRMRRSRQNFANEKDPEASTSDIAVSAFCENTLRQEHICDEAAKNTSSSPVTAAQLKQPKSRKRRARDNLSDNQEPTSKKARTSLGVEDSPLLFPIEPEGKSQNLPVSDHTVRSYSTSDRDNVTEQREKNSNFLSPMKDCCEDFERKRANQGAEISVSSTEDGLTTGSDTEVSPLLFPEETSEKSTEEPTCSTSVRLSSNNDVAIALFQDDAETVVSCVDSGRVGDDLCRSDNKEMKATPVEMKEVRKRKKPFSASGAKEEEKTNLRKRKKPWKCLLKLLPQPEQGKSPRKKTSATKFKGEGKSGKINRKESKKLSKSQSTSKTHQGMGMDDLYLPRTRLFYASNLSQKLSKKHVMEATPVSMNGARKLVYRIFLQGSYMGNGKSDVQNVKIVTGASNNQKQTPTKNEKVTKGGQNAKNASGVLSNHKQTPSKKKKPFRLPKRLKRIVPLFLIFLARHRKCPFQVLLKHHCTFSERRARVIKSGKKKGRLFSTPKTTMWSKRRLKRHGSKGVKRPPGKKKIKVDVLVYRHAVSNYTRHDQVIRFLECVCHKVVPKELWGCPHNKRTFLRNLAKFLQLHRGEKFSLGQMMEGIKVSKCEWLKMKAEEKRKFVPLSDSRKQQQLLSQFIWWFVTQYLMPLIKGFFYITESGTNRQRIFYYRKPVWRKIQQFGINMLCGEFFKPLKTKEAERLLSSKSSLGFSPLRFIPKSSTVRPITNMKHCPSIKEPTNAQKQQSINRKLQNLFEVLKFEKERNAKSLGATLFGNDDLYRVLRPFAERVREYLDGKPLFFVHVDVKHCYESIPHQKLFDIMKGMFEEEEYLIRRFALLRMSSGKVFREFYKHVSNVDDCRSFPDFFQSLITAWKLKRNVAVDQVWYLTEDRDKLITLLKEHVFNNVVRIGNNYYQQIKGIAQGSILSTMLCGYFYSDMEKTHLSEISQDPDSLLLRWVDDFLFITPHKILASKFLNVMHNGIPEYGCFINREKTLTNFDAVTDDGEQVKKVCASTRFPWCGYLFDTVTLEVRCDLSRYTGLPLRDTLSVALDAHPGQALRWKLRYSVRPKCHPLLLDNNLNSRGTVLLNVYQLFLLTAYKFHTYAKELPKGRQPKDNPSFFCGLLIDVAQYFHSTSLRKSRQLSPNNAAFSLDEYEVTWLCFHAFRTCLQRKQSRYRELLRFLKMGLSRLWRGNQELKNVTAISEHAVFKNIR